MAPDADQVRQRRPVELEDKDVNDIATSATTARTLSVKTLKPNEICIHGVVYDLNGFDHPGGDDILLFGGNDVTVQYKMIHPYHTSKHLEKLTRIGIAKDFQIDYKFDTPFEQELKREVFKIVRRGREFGTPGYFFRAFLYISLFFGLQCVWATQGTSVPLAIVFGMSQALIGMNVQHDANHGACSKRPWINATLGLFADLIGGSRWLWMEQHWTHHSYTNDEDKDPDGKGAEPYMLFNDYTLNHPRRQWIHRFQALYYMIVLAGYWLSSVFNPEVLDLRQRGALGVGMKMDSPYVVNNRKYAIGLRLLYIYLNVISPFRVATESGNSFWTTFGHIMLMGASSSLSLAVLFSLSHNFVGAERDPTKRHDKEKDKQEDDEEPVCWYKSQVETSCTYGGRISGYVTGGLNFQVEHHLFPRMSSSWYPYIAPTVREICKKHGVQYVYFPWVWQNWISTMQYLHAAGTGINWAKPPENPYRGNL